MGLVASVSLIPASFLSTYGLYDDRTAHFCFYAVMTMVLSLCLFRNPSTVSRYTATIITATVFLSTMETAQVFIETRNGWDWDDILSSMSGVAAGVLLLIFLESLPLNSRKLQAIKQKEVDPHLPAD